MHVHQTCILACVGVTAVAAVTDARTGRIPNWLTVPPMVLGPLVWGASGGLTIARYGPPFGTLLGSLGSLVVCALPAFFLWKGGAMGGGDVKLFAAIGALGLSQFGLESFGFSIFTLLLFALGRLAWEGKLFRVLSNALFLVLNVVLPRKYRREIRKETLVTMRFGPSIFVGTLIATLASNQIHGLL